jgi:hypothetical protein
MLVSDNVTLYGNKYSKTNVNYYKLTNKKMLINTWKYITKNPELDTTIKTPKIIRLENLLWRQWYKLHFNLKQSDFKTGIDYKKKLIGPVTDIEEIDHKIWNIKLKRCTTCYIELNKLNV